MAHQHSVVDGDIHFIINPITRAITRTDSTKASLVVGDHNSERFTFEIPKVVEGHDMSKCNVVRIHYLNTSSKNPSVQSLGVYEVDDFGVDPKNTNSMTLSWLISRKATEHVGSLSFTIQFACMTGFKIDYSWQSGVFSAITVADAIDGAEVVIEEYADILQQWWEHLYATSELPISVMSHEDYNSLDEDIQKGMLYMLYDDPADENIGKIPSIEQNITNLTSEVNTNKQNITDLTSEVNTNKQNITDLTSEVNTDKEYITNLHSALNDAISDISAIRTDVSTCQKDITNANARIDPIYAEYELLYDSAQGINKEVPSGLYVLRIVNPVQGYTDGSVATGLTMLTDTLSYKSTGYENFSVFDPITCDIKNYMIKIIRSSSDPLEPMFLFTPHYANEAQELVAGFKIYGRCIYENPKG